MPCPYALPTHRSVCTSGLALRGGRWSAGKMPAPQHNQGGSGTRPCLDQHHSPFAIRHSPFSFPIPDSQFVVCRCCGGAGTGAALLRRYGFVGLRQGGSGTRPYLHQHRSPFAIRYSPFAVFIPHSRFAVFCRSPLAARRSPSFSFGVSSVCRRCPAVW
jgi:hypothetical protein